MNTEPASGAFSFTVRRPVATTMAVLAVATFGFISLGKIPLELLPEISYPTITIRTEYPGAGPEDIEERVSKPIEESLAVLSGLESHSSISRAGVSDVALEFRWGTNLSMATQDIRERLDRTRLPTGAKSPLILRYDPSLDPVIRMSVYGNAGLDALRTASDEIVAKGLATIPGVAAVKVRGGLETEIQVVLDADKLAALGLDISEVDRRLKIENVNLASGTLVEGDTEYVVRTLNQFENLNDILELALADRGGQPIRIQDVARVERTHKKRDVVTRVDGWESTELMVYREASANIVELARRVRDRLFGSESDRLFLKKIETGEMEDPKLLLDRALASAEAEKDANPSPEGQEQTEGGGDAGRWNKEGSEITALRALVKKKRKAEEFLVARLPADINVRILSDQSIFIQKAIDEVRAAALVGGVLAIFILLLFLKNLVATAIIAVSIPVSIIATFAPMYLSETTINIMSLGGLALGIGMLVDNSIVVLESIFRCREQGDSRVTASVRGTSEVGMAVVASTATTIAVFFPIAFVSGVAGQLFGDQALTVVFSLISSLAVALFFIPMLAARGGSAQKFRPRPIGFLLEIVTPVFLPVRTTAARSFTETGKRNGHWRLPLVLILLPVAVVQYLVETFGRLFLAIATSLFFLVVLCGLVIVRITKIVGWPLTRLFDLIYQAIHAGYPKLLRSIIQSPMLMAGTLVIASVAALLAWNSATALRSEMLPEVHQGEVIAHVYYPVGTPVERTADMVTDLEEQMLGLPDVSQVSTAIGVARDEVADPDQGSHSVQMLLTMDQTADPAQAENRTLNSCREILSTRPELLGFRFSRPTVLAIKAPLEVHAMGDNLDDLREAAQEIAIRLKDSGLVSDVRSTVSRGSPEVLLTFDRERLRRFGLDLEAISNRIRAEVQGVVSTRFAENARRIDIRVMADIVSLSRLLDLTVNRGQAVGLTDTLDRGAEGGGGSSGTGTASIRDRALYPGTIIDLSGDAAIPLRQVADIRVVKGPSEIRRIDGQRAAVVTANTAGLDVGRAVSSIDDMLSFVESDRPDLITSVGGQGAELDSALGGMRSALLLAVFLVYLVLASQFESIIQPLIILLTIPLALVGAVFALNITDTPLSVVVLIGVIVLSGIVVNNAIVLIDYTNRLRARGKNIVDALEEAGTARLRPILMTTLSTILALLPLAGILKSVPGIDHLQGIWWRGSELQAPLAITIIGGLAVSTLLTLVIIPVVYRLLQRDKTSAAVSDS